MSKPNPTILAILPFLLISGGGITARAQTQSVGSGTYTSAPVQPYVFGSGSNGRTPGYSAFGRGRTGGSGGTGPTIDYTLLQNVLSTAGASSTGGDGGNGGSGLTGGGAGGGGGSPGNATVTLSSGTSITIRSRLSNSASGFVGAMSSVAAGNGDGVQDHGQAEVVVEAVVIHKTNSQRSTPTVDQISMSCQTTPNTHP